MDEQLKITKPIVQYFSMKPKQQVNIIRRPSVSFSSPNPRMVEWRAQTWRARFQGVWHSQGPFPCQKECESSRGYEGLQSKGGVETKTKIKVWSNLCRPYCSWHNPFIYSTNTHTHGSVYLYNYSSISHMDTNEAFGLSNPWKEEFTENCNLN